MYAGLAAFITVVYVVLVAGVGAAAGDAGQAPGCPPVAAAVVAVAFQPARARAARLANRVVYGRRATPYQVLSDFAGRIGGVYSIEDVLPDLARVVAAGAGARLRRGLADGRRRTARRHLHRPGPAGRGLARAPPLPPPGRRARRPARRGRRGPGDPGTAGCSAPSASPCQGASRCSRPAVSWWPTWPSQAGLALANVGLVEDLRASRQRLVTAQDEARRRLERNLHDGAQQNLVSLVIKAGPAAEGLAGLPEACQALDELRRDAAAALENLRDLARGIYPPRLADLGLAAALGAQASRLALPVTVNAGALGQFPEETEAAVYFCCIEALQNIAKHAAASRAGITLRAAAGTLTFSVADDGTGFDAARYPARRRAAEHVRPPLRPRRPPRGDLSPGPGDHHHRPPPGAARG